VLQGHRAKLRFTYFPTSPKPIAQRFVPVATARLLAGLSSARPAFAEAGNQPARLGVEFELACLDLGKVEYLVDQAEQVERRGNGGFVRPGATSSRKPRARQGVSRQTSNKRPPWICCAERGLLRRLGGDEESGVVPLARYGIPPRSLISRRRFGVRQGLKTVAQEQFVAPDRSRDSVRHGKSGCGMEFRFTGSGRRRT
jgi:hypothetical protein